MSSFRTMIVNSQALFRVVFAFGLYFSYAHGSITCSDSLPPFCRDAGLSGTSFPTLLGHDNAEDAEEAFATTFGSNTPTDSCSLDLGFFACSVYFPDCRFNNATGENVVRLPCRDFCERIKSDCPNFPGAGSGNCNLFPWWNPVKPIECYDPYHLIVINEVDIAENRNTFVELWDYGMGDTLLMHYVLLVGNGNSQILDIVDLNGTSTRSNGYFLIGDKSTDLPVDKTVVVEYSNDAGYVAIYRNTAESAASSIVFDFFVDGVVYQTTSDSIIDSSLRDLFATPQEPLLDRADQSGSISRCTSFQQLNSSAFLFVSSTPGVSNACSQITSKDAYYCCASASVFCAFNILNENANDGYCQNRNLWRGQSSPSYVTAMSFTNCSLSPEALALVQPLNERNILLESCPIASIERSHVSIILKSVDVLHYSPVERISANKSPNCSASLEECEIFLVSSLINNSTSQVSVEAKCDGANVIGFTIGYLCLGTNKFPCASGKPWKIVARPAGLAEVEILCPSTPGFQNIRGGNTATLLAPNQTNEYFFNVNPLPDGSSFALFVEFRVELFYNDDLKVAIDVVVPEKNANVYRAFSVVPSQGLYQVLNEFEFE